MELFLPEMASGLVPPSVPVQTIGLVDTGAQGTLIDESLADELGLVATGALSIVATGAEAQDWPTVYCRVVLPGDSIWELTTAVGPLLSHGFGCILGRDLLMDCRLDYDGPSESFTLSY